MELWVRSQDKERIIKTNQLDVMELATDVGPRYNHFGIYDNEYLVGEYKNKERALEVLDEIQNKIKPEYMLKSINNPDEPTQYEGYYEEQPTIVYEMPKE